MDTIKTLKYKYNNLNSFGKIIAVNAFVFCVFLILEELFELSVFETYFSLPSDFFSFLKQPWSIITYGFLHADLRHIFFNMLFLYYLSRVAVNLFRQKMILNIYFLGIICGGTLYLLVANLWPTDFFGSKTVLYGASAGVGALLVFVATYMPNSEIRPFNLFTIKWKHLALIFVGLDIIRMLSGYNRGGYVAHIGGYLLGYYYAKQLVEGTDIGLGFEKMMDWFMSLFTSKSHLKTVHRSQSKTSNTKKTKSDFNSFNKQNQIDLILEKIAKSGYDSLTSEEKEFLFRAGK